MTNARNHEIHERANDLVELIRTMDPHDEYHLGINITRVKYVEPNAPEDRLEERCYKVVVIPDSSKKPTGWVIPEYFHGFRVYQVEEEIPIAFKKD